MNTKLIWITPSAESLIAKIARVSSPNNQESPNYTKLIKYLLVNRHFSPFEMVSVCFEIKTSRAISAQIIRHRSFSFQEFSQRYAEVIDIEPIEIRRQAVKNRQSSEEVFDPPINYGENKMTSSTLISLITQQTQWAYNQLVQAGVAKECARMIMPMASSTTLYMTGTLRSWIHYLGLRNDEHAQKEHRLLAIEIENELRRHFPIVFTALDQLKQEDADMRLLHKMLTNHEYDEYDATNEFLMELLHIISK